MSLTFQPAKALRPVVNVGAYLDPAKRPEGAVIYGSPNPRFCGPVDVDELRRLAMAVGINVDEEKAVVERFCERLKSRMAVIPQVPVLPDQPEGGEHPFIVLDSLSLYLEQK